MKYPSNVDINLILKHALYMYFPKTKPIQAVDLPVQVKYQKKSSSLPRSRNNSMSEPSKVQQKKNPSALSELQLQQAKKLARLNHLQSITGVNGPVINGISENSRELMSMELRHAQDIIMITQHKLTKYLSTFRKHINRNHPEEMNQAVEGIEELCALLDVKFSSASDFSAPVDAALEANEDKRRDSSTSLVEKLPKEVKNRNGSEKTQYEVPEVKDNSQLFGKKKSVEMKTFLSEWQQIEVEEDGDQVLDPLGALCEKRK